METSEKHLRENLWPMDPATLRQERNGEWVASWQQEPSNVDRVMQRIMAVGAGAVKALGDFRRVDQGYELRLRVHVPTVVTVKVEPPKEHHDESAGEPGPEIFVKEALSFWQPALSGKRPTCR